MDLDKAIQGRRSVRHFQAKKPSKQQLLELVKAGNNAPSACNIQGWRFVAIDDKNVLDKLVGIGAASFLKNVPCAILVFYDNRTDNLEYMDHIQSASAAVQNMLLKAYAIGLGTCWVNHLPPKKELQKLFKSPKHFEPIALIAVGFPSKKPFDVKRKASPEELLSLNSFQFKEKSGAGKGLRTKRILRKAYYSMPFRKHLKPIAEKFEKKFD